MQTREMIPEVPKVHEIITDLTSQARSLRRRFRLKGERMRSRFSDTNGEFISSTVDDLMLLSQGTAEITENRTRSLVRGRGFEPLNPYGTGS
jgi:hypothetical protein